MLNSNSKKEVKTEYDSLIAEKEKVKDLENNLRISNRKVIDLYDELFVNYQKIINNLYYKVSVSNQKVIALEREVHELKIQLNSK